MRSPGESRADASRRYAISRHRRHNLRSRRSGHLRLRLRAADQDGEGCYRSDERNAEDECHRVSVNLYGMRQDSNGSSGCEAQTVNDTTEAAWVRLLTSARWDTVIFQEESGMSRGR